MKTDRQIKSGGVGGLLKEGDLYPCYDANGNITQKLNSSGETVMNVAYDPFGNIVSGTLEGEYGFSTKPFVDGPDWYYYGFRYYDPVTGRWPSRDPLLEYSAFSNQFKLMVFQEYESFLLEYTLSGNGYNFVINNPVLYLDYLGAAPDLFGGPSRPSSPTVWDAVKQTVLGAITEVFGPCLIPGDEKDAVEKIYCLHVCADPCKNGAFKNKRGNYKKTVTYRCSGGRWNEIKSQIYEPCDAAACPSGYDDKGYNPSESAP